MLGRQNSGKILKNRIVKKVRITVILIKIIIMNIFNLIEETIYE